MSNVDFFAKTIGKILSYIGLGIFTAGIVVTNPIGMVGGMIFIIMGSLIHEVGEN